MFRSVRTVLVFAVDPRASAQWWAEVLDVPARFDIDGESVYAWVDVAGVELGLHPADPARTPPGGSTVPYWGVDDHDAVRDRLLAAGCVHHRGPLVIEPGRRICRPVDPFGFVFGLEGPWRGHGCRWSRYGVSGGTSKSAATPVGAGRLNG